MKIKEYKMPHMYYRVYFKNQGDDQVWYSDTIWSLDDAISIKKWREQDNCEEVKIVKETIVFEEIIL